MGRFTRSKVPPEVADFHERVASAFADAERSQFYSAVLLEDISLDGAATTPVPHKLGRKVRGFVVVKKDTSSDISWDLADTADLTKYLPLFTDAMDTVASLVVF